MKDADVTCEQRIVEILTEKKLTVTTAESCTGGMIASTIINVSGASEVYNEGFITYSNEAKIKYLGVNSDTLLEHGAVSLECAYEMASGVCKTTGADVSVVSTGIAGPGGGTKDKPVGLVYIGCCINGDTITRECHFAGDRMSVRTAACKEALRILLERLESI